MNTRCCYGGTFDPVHKGHMYFAEKILQAFRPAELFFIPAYRSPFKDTTGHAEDVHRVNMLRIAVKDRPQIRVSTAEIERGGVSYTLDTLKAFHAACPAGRLFWVIGDDNLEDLHKWKGYPAHFDYADFIVLPRRRPGDLEKRLADHPYADRLHPLAAETVKISSTEIRRRIAAGKAVDGLVPEAVHAYIQEHGLYR